jgi:hypothetical protein
MANELETLPEECGGPLLGKSVRLLSEIILGARKAKLNRSQYVMFLMADMITWCEIADALCHKASVHDNGLNRSAAFIKAAARLFVFESLEKVYVNGLRICCGSDPALDDLKKKLMGLDFEKGLKNHIRDMDFIAAELVA